MSESEEPLDTSMSAHYGEPSAVAKLLKATQIMVNQLPDDLRLSVEVDIWEHGARDGDEERFTEEAEQ